MKKIYILAFAAMLSTAGIAQKSMQRPVGSETAKASTHTKGLLSAENTALRSSRALIWSDDFSTPANWTMANTGVPPRDWVITNAVPANLVTAGFDATFTSTSGGNFALYNSDAGGSGAVDNANLTIVTPINLTGYGNVMLTFDQYYAKYADVVKVQISTDGLAWTDFVVNTAYAANQASTNPEVVTVDISSVATNQATVWVRFNFTGAWDYAWMIDDVAINAALPTPADVAGLEVYIPSGCMLTTVPVEFWIKNNGTLPATGFDVRYIVNGGTPVVETYTGTIPAGDTVLYTFTSMLDMTAPGLYDITAVATITSDADATNDSANWLAESVAPATIPYMTGFENTVADLSGWTVLDNDGTGYTFGLSPVALTGTQSLWAFENNIATASNDWAFSRCIDMVAATNYRIKYWTRLTTGYEGSFGVSTGMTADVAGMTQTIKALTPLAATSLWVIDSADFMVPTTGTYYVGLNAVNTNAAASLSIRIDDLSIMEVVSGVGISESANSDLSVYPSPSTGVFNINVNAVNAQIEVYDIVGKRVYAENQLAKGTNVINLTNLAEGAYFVKVISGSKVSTQKIIISK
jgi:hypothetical protein